MNVYGPTQSQDFMQECQERLSSLSRDDLEALLSDPEYFDAFFGTLPSTIALYDEHDALLRANEELTARNLDYRPKLDTLRSETALAFQSALDSKVIWATVEKDQAEAYKGCTPPALLNRLRAALSEQEHLTEQLAARFQDGQLDEASFAMQYKEARRIWHKRALCAFYWKHRAGRTS
ncbi:uncharacterized protein L969DRAFT_93024 [Mixia osmundae IAM 14324]|uniref:VPS37 C-terminal domain-containing protein n=1 Tax=Mixia osmundae (strain CBS 9802 / IAM 14324 / JCM 22182 / KY 12970) TaxID=764103 RepID=G7E6C1_MIXOS|nr:uncharacterized protein L969DRAFT_93024 [Mixia osmundae IAM 14324]KEI40462.1 hypothetical protein L969DRAFT_93024 [Mixia osmundae IAM 14324]GAA98381.1 hypothetical protein E5Q_05067 [Mixia osmundae IAM 14324]